MKNIKNIKYGTPLIRMCAKKNYDCHTFQKLDYFASFRSNLASTVVVHTHLALDLASGHVGEKNV